MFQPKDYTHTRARAHTHTHTHTRTHTRTHTHTHAHTHVIVSRLLFFVISIQKGQTDTGINILRSIIFKESL